MTLATVYLVEEQHMIKFYGGDATAVARELADSNAYRKLGSLVAKGQGAEAAEECFDLSNNPSRQEERDVVWGANRSLSVGDLVEVGEDRWLCAAMGWVKL